MRIGFDGKRATHNFRGLGNYSRSLIEGLIEYAPTEELFLYTPLFEEKRAIDWVNRFQNKLYVRTPENFVSKKFPALWRSYFLEQRTELDNLDIFHGLSHELPFFLKKSKAKWIVTIHDLLFFRYPEFFPFIDRQVYFQKFKRACTSADLVIAICEQTKKDIIELLNIDEKKIVVHYQSCDPQFYKDVTEEQRARVNLPSKYILHVGAFEPNKNQLTLLEAFALIANELPHDLVFIGQGKQYLEKVKLRAEQLGLKARVHFLNKVNFSELPVYYQKADLFCFPSLFEGFGIPILEALFSKTPVLTSKGSCFPESAGPHSFYIDPLSSNEIAVGIKTVLGSLELQNKMKEEGYKFVQRFHREETTKRLIKIYKNTL
jgi:glycosyltransferase involved in cell wall biosynthesis